MLPLKADNDIQAQISAWNRTVLSGSSNAEGFVEMGALNKPAHSVSMRGVVVDTPVGAGVLEPAREGPGVDVAAGFSTAPMSGTWSYLSRILDRPLANCSSARRYYSVNHHRRTLVDDPDVPFLELPLSD